MIYVECKTDKILIESLGIKSQEIWHCGGRGKVILQLSKGERNCGMIDEDPQSHQKLNFENFEKKTEKYDIILFEDSKNNLLIVLKPNLEGWILKTAKKNNLNVKEYGLPDNIKELHGITNLDLISFKKFLNELKKTEEFKFLKEVFIWKR